LPIRKLEAVILNDTLKKQYGATVLEKLIAYKYNIMFEQKVVLKKKKALLMLVIIKD